MEKPEKTEKALEKLFQVLDITKIQNQPFKNWLVWCLAQLQKSVSDKTMSDFVSVMWLRIFLRHRNRSQTRNLEKE